MSTLQSCLKFSVLISSYNYRDFVLAAVESALAQTLAPCEVIVVDDGSTDDSLALLRERFAGASGVKILSQPNRGQMTAWIHGFEHCTGDVIALLDSDDLWEPGYLAGMAAVYDKHPSVDVVYCNMRMFGARDGLMLKRRWHQRDRDLGCSVLLGCFHPRWQGNATSANTVRRELFGRILALPPQQAAQWKTRPDDCLFYGADILGGHKFYMAAALARHREHESNALMLEKESRVRRLRYELRRERMLAHYREAALAGPRLLSLAKSEFRTKPQPVFIEWWLYTCMALRAPQRWSLRLGQVLAIAGHFIGARAVRGPAE
jgi:glycosyltransferase involved in cell wall biosynthesis